MVEMRHQVDFLLGCTVAADQFQQRRVINNPEWIEGRYLAADTNDLDMINLANLPDDFFQLSRGQNERIAAGQENIVDFAVLSQVRDGFADVVRNFVVIAGEQSLAKTKTTIGSAYVVDQEQSGIRIFMLHAPNYGIGRFFTCVPLTELFQFCHFGHYDPTDRVTRIIPVDQRLVILIGTKDKAISYRPKRFSFLRIDRRDLVNPGKVLGVRI